MTLDSPRSFLKAGVGFVVVGSLSALILGLAFLLVPEEATIRPMGAGLLIALIAFFTWFGGLFCLLRGWRGGALWLRCCVFLLAFAPFPFFQIGLRFAQAVRGFTLAQ